MSFSLTPEAERELEEAFAYYLEHGSKKVAERFLDEFSEGARIGAVAHQKRKPSYWQGRP